MLGTLGNRGLRQIDRQDVALPARRETFDMARRGRYLALLRRWAQERLPAGTRAAPDAAEWVRDALSGTAGPEGEAARDASREGASLLVRLRARLLADRPQQLRARLAERSAPSARVEQLIGCDRLDVWEGALAALARRPRELVILRIEFGLDYEAIAIEMGIGVTAARAETVNALAALIDALGGQRRDRAA
jgi:RNA polymerase sigma-70 factor, ECF subfamily